ncbi:hypothetical protein [Sphingobacterium sp.]|uniref:hypothetical protein n=1 Tax=Sphingobacterium sp. TaxID=341027 RepID=UPI00289BF6ED|nr:hypothetical protein [Sphingobacterium sp.]
MKNKKSKNNQDKTQKLLSGIYIEKKLDLFKDVSYKSGVPERAMEFIKNCRIELKKLS